MNNKLILSLLLGLVLITSSSFAEDKINIGVIIPLSGDFASWGELVRSGIEAGSSPEINLIFEDSLGQPKQTVSAFKKLTNIDKVTYIIGPSCGSPQKAIAPLVKSKDILVMLTSSATAKLFELSSGNYFAPQYSIEQESEFIANHLNLKKHKTSVIIYLENEFSRAHEAAFKNKYRGEILDIIRIPAFESRYIKDAALRIKKLSPEVIFLPDVTPLLLGIRSELSKIGEGKIPVYSVYSAEMQDVLDVEGKNAENIIYSYPKINGKNAISFFPKIGTEMIIQAALHCKKDISCAKKFLKTQYSFNELNIRHSDIELKTVKNGKFKILADANT